MYPNGTTLCHVLGYTNDAGTGMNGVEASMNNRLQSFNGERNVERDRTGREIVLYRGQDRQPKDGGNVRLTIDLNLQQIVESEIDGEPIPTKVTLPLTINGRIFPRENIDVYSFSARKPSCER